MERLNINIDDIKKLIELVEKHKLAELKVTEDDLEIVVKGQPPVQPQAGPMVVQSPMATQVAPEQLETTEEEQVEAEPEEQFEGNIFDIVAPLVGVFYRAPSPDAPNFVEIGDSVEVGTEVGLIEAMKVFSPIPSEVAGVVVDIPGQNGKLVQQGDVLVRVRVEE